MTENAAKFLKPESQTISKCSEIRQECRDNIFSKMDDLHVKQMNVMGDIKTDVAYMKGKQEALLVTNTQKRNGSSKRDWTGIAIKILITWGPPLAFIMVIGLIALLKSKGWL